MSRFTFAFRVATGIGIVVGALVAPAAAQITTGTVTGTVKDQQGAVIPGATVVLVSEAQGTQSSPVVTSTTGDFVVASISPDTYTVEISMPSFKTVKRPGVVVNAGDRRAIGSLTLEVGGTTETIEVRAETPEIQSTTGERSFTIETDAVANLPLATRSFTSLLSLIPGVGEGSNPTRAGDRASTGGGNNNVMMDGVSTMDTGSNRPLVELNVESIAQVKVLTTSYQAEYGRSSGLQITTVTKSGTNQYRGSMYDVERNSAWNANSRQNALNGDPKNIVKQRDWGYSIGGPIGKPGRKNTLFFFHSLEFQPRTAGNDRVRYRVPTEAERLGDFSASTDQNGNLYNSIRNPNISGTCSATNRTACFQDGGVVGRIPASALYATGLNLLKMFPLPNLAAAQGQPYNYEITRPEESVMGYQPVVRVDYRPTGRLRGTVKWGGFRQRKQTINGSIPGFNDTRAPNPVVITASTTVNYNLSPTAFFEGTFGYSHNEQAGCSVGTGGTTMYCQVGLPMNPISNRVNAGLGDLPFLFPGANVLNPNYYAYQALGALNPPIWDGREILMPPSFSYGSRVSSGTPSYAPPNVPFPGFLNVNSTYDVSLSLTKIRGRHTYKAGFYNTHSYKAQQRTGSFGMLNFGQDTVGTNPFDTSFGFANAAVGTFSSYQQASKYVEGNFIYNNTEGYIQDNWRVSPRLTLDYGVRLVHQQPQYDGLGQAANFLPDRWKAGDAPLLYAAGCVDNANPCTGTNRQARDPRTGQLLGPNSSINIGTLVTNTGNLTNGLFLSGQGIAETTYTWPNLGIAPRFGFAWDVTGRQRLVLRGGSGLYFDRPSGNSIFSQVSNPPTSRTVTVRYGQLQNLSKAGLSTEGAPALNVYEYDAKLPASVQWNGGVQMALPFATTLDVEYVGHYSYNLVETVNLNAIDFGSAFLPQFVDPTLPGTTPSATIVPLDQMRSFKGYSSITQSLGRGWVAYSSVQFSLNRRFSKGLSFGFNDTIGIANPGNGPARLEHGADGSYRYRADQSEADSLIGRAPVQRQVMKANFVWDMPDIRSARPMLKAAGLVLNDWQLSGVWSGRTGASYTIGFSYNNGGGNTNLTGSNDYGARVRIVDDPGSGCSSDGFRQFNTSAFQGPPIGSVGLESGNDYLRACFRSTLDMALARNIRFGKRTIQLRVDVFNVPNAAAITARQTSMNLSNPADPVTITNLAYDPTTGLLNDGVNLLSSGAVSVNRSQPKNAGFGVATDFQTPRTVQLQIRFSF